MSKSSEKRPIGITSLVCLVIANMIGVGVYTTSGHTLEALGSPALVMLMWVLGSVIAFTGALCYGALARQLSRSGGEYLFLSRGLHPLAGFMAGWISLLAGFTGAISAAATGFAVYFPADYAMGFSEPVLATLLIALCALPHFRHVRSAAISQNVLVFLKLCAIITLIVVGLIAIASQTASEPEIVQATSPSIFVFANQLMWISFSFAGFNAAIYVAGEAKLGRQTVRKSMLLATVGVSVIYLCLNYVFLYSAPVSELSGKHDIAAISGQHIGGPHLALAVRVVVALSLATSVSSMLLAGPRVYAKMADDGLFPRVFDSTSGVPRAAIMLQVLLAIALVWASDLRGLIDFTSFLLSISAAATVGCLLLPRFAGRKGHRPMTGWPWVPLFFVAATFSIAVLGFMHHYSKSPKNFAIGIAIICSGFVIYFAQSKLKQTSE